MPNPNPSPETRFKPGTSGNPGGKTSAQRDLEVRNAELATRISNKFLEELATAVEGGSGDEVLAHVRAEVLKLIKDSQDRGLGTPRQSIEHTSPDGSMTPTFVIRDMTKDG